jgi:hypothetical protein
MSRNHALLKFSFIISALCSLWLLSGVRLRADDGAVYKTSRQVMHNLLILRRCGTRGKIFDMKSSRFQYWIGLKNDPFR